MSFNGKWIKPLGFVALGIFGIYVLFTGLSGAAPPRSAKSAPDVHVSEISLPNPPRVGATLVGQFDHHRRSGFSAVEILPRPEGIVLVAQLRGFLGIQDPSTGRPAAPPTSAGHAMEIARNLRHARLERDGHFSCAGLAPGDYVVIAFSLEAASQVAGRPGSLTVLTGRQRIAPHSDGRIIKLARLTPLR